MGDRVRVRLAHTNPERGFIDFVRLLGAAFLSTILFGGRRCTPIVGITSSSGATQYAAGL